MDRTVPAGAALSLDLIEAIAGKRQTQRQKANAQSVIAALERYGPRFGLDQPHRLAQFLPQILHESMAFHYDREVWGPTPAQKRYDTRTDLGNTKARDGDGKRYKGRTSLQITGRANYRAFTKWSRKHIDASGPDFVKYPERVNTYPWEGLVPIWYWSTRKLNRYADAGDIEMITKLINGGFNGYADRLAWYTATALVLLGYDRANVKGFQKDAGLTVDGIPGPRTRAAFHAALVNFTEADERAPDIQTAPVIEERDKPVVPPAVETEVKKKTTVWQWIVGVFGSGGLGVAGWSDADWQTIAAIAGGSVGVLIVVLLLRRQIISAVSDIREAVEETQ